MERRERHISGNLGLATVVAVSLVLAVMGVAAQAQTFSVLYSFTGGQDGGNPSTGLRFDVQGRLLGTTYSGGRSDSGCDYPPGCGTAFRMTPSGSGWRFAPLLSFTMGHPNGRLTVGPNGTLYGTTYDGVYNLQPPASASASVFPVWRQTLIYEFSFNQGFDSMGDVAFDAAGNLYGTNFLGGVVNTCSGGLGCGTVWELSQSGGSWGLSRFYKLTGHSDGIEPVSGVVLDQAGNVYVASSQGYYDNNAQWGAVFELTPSGSSWTETTLYDFQTGSGIIPVGGLISDNAGNLYGGTSATGENGGGGTVFKLSFSGSQWNFSNLDVLTGGGSGRTGVEGKLMMDANGSLYGTTYADGAYGKGSVFMLTPGAGGWSYTTLHDFTGGSDGANPMSTLVMDDNGNLYGTAYAGGNTGGHCDSGFGYQCGVVFEITP
ncbi:MAG: choice-of-anchor tandem repeat GloVer-containing protein [Candidatus Korobacteraceae bacterium]